jgi:hypothetical protein
MNWKRFRPAARVFVSGLIGYLVTSFIAWIGFAVFAGSSPAAPIVGLFLLIFPVMPIYLAGLLEGTQRWWLVALIVVFGVTSFLSWKVLNRKNDA